MNTPACEQETIIRFYRDEDRATVYTSDPTMMTKFDKLIETSEDWAPESATRCKDGTTASKTYTCPKKFVSFRSKAITQNLTDEERERRAARFRK